MGTVVSGREVVRSWRKAEDLAPESMTVASLFLITTLYRIYGLMGISVGGNLPESRMKFNGLQSRTPF